MPKPPLIELEKNLGYSFKDQSLLEIALMHRSSGAPNNERLEFFGDSILGFVISEYLFQQFPKASEGQLTRLRARLVKKETLSIIAKSFEIEKFVTLGPGELQAGGAQRSSIQADAVEAIIAAIYLESGIEAAKSCIHSWFAAIFDGLSMKDVQKDPKTQLQEWLQSKHLSLPEYELKECDGPAHRQIFTIECLVEGYPPQSGIGKSRRIAEQEAAGKMLEVIKEQKNND
ncbi:MAG: ribonuclease III [Legionellales bacterium]|nr:ribonuclease III [Legionellales bacterium]|tara:strand:- start:597 stop:1286 length:690 start_codon:yes stop_codon:yes gene_type:complete